MTALLWRLSNEMVRLKGIAKFDLLFLYVVSEILIGQV